MLAIAPKQKENPWKTPNMKRFPTHRYLLSKIRQIKIPTSWYLFLSILDFAFD
ncbi:hypothetical protein LEP1GSC047_1734 [Leptospira inadai serovar Lyme str. 10]|uniref:Uncharacterized protein n=1 Tax=Leptospira inadai serovar Lyme str. 10 TaxID=1049790 RepID=V6HA07_9LEPT|nr:hypothetical protein LEP1GSC047_1734 [Leptospira inadai serovar Lyme str. 10]